MSVSETVKLADFGLAQPTHMPEDACATDSDSCAVSVGCSSGSRSVDSECSSSSRMPAVICTAGGTPLYAAPEVLRAMFRNHGMQSAVGPKVRKQEGKGSTGLRNTDRATVGVPESACRFASVV